MYKEKIEHKESYSGKRTTEDEVDISFIFNKFRAIIMAISNSFIYLFQIIVKRLFLFIAFISVGALLGYVAYYTSKPFYTSSMTLLLPDIRSQFVENQFARLSTMITEGNYEAVAEDLNIELEKAGQIKSMSFTNLDHSRVEEDSVLMGSPFEIELTVYDKSLFSALEPAISGHLQKNSFFSEQKKIKEEQTRRMIAKLTQDIASIDSIKEAIASPKGPVNGFVYGEAVDPTNLYRESIKMYEEKTRLESYLAQLNNIQIINGFAPRLNPSGPYLLYYLLAGTLIALLAGIIVALTLENKKRQSHI